MTALDAEIVGHYDPGVTELANTGILTTLNFMQRLLDTDHVTHYSIWLRNPNLLAENSRTISERLKAKGHNLDIYPWNDKQLSPMYTGTIQFLETLINFLASVLGVVIVFSIFNSATMTVIERAPEIGMMRSMGYKKSHIRQLFIQEAVVLTLLSLIAGGILGAVFIFGVNQGDIYLYPPGISGGLRLELKPDLITCLVAGLLIFVLATLATGFATRNVIKKGISNLLMGSNR
jgi:putative ABC transport system permease protein